MKKGMTFEDASAQLEEILSALSDENTPLDESVKLYARAAEYIAFCDEALKKAQMKIEEIDAQYTPPEEPAGA